MHIIIIKKSIRHTSRYFTKKLILSSMHSMHYQKISTTQMKMIQNMNLLYCGM